MWQVLDQKYDTEQDVGSQYVIRAGREACRALRMYIEI